MATKTKPESQADTSHQHAQDDPADGVDTSESGLFDKSDFNDPRLLLEDERGNKIDEVVLTFTGRVKLSRHDPDSVAFARQVVLSRYADIDFALSGNWVGRHVKLNPEREDGGGGERVLELKAHLHSIDIQATTPAT